MATETEGIQAQSADISDTTVIVPVTGAIYHNGNEKPTERWCFELGMRTVSDKDFTSVLSRLQKGFNIKEKCAKFKIQLSSKDIICIWTTYKHNQDVLELKEEELILLQDEIQQTSDVLTLTEATEISADEPEVMRHSSRRRKRRFAEDYLYYD